MTSSFSGSAHSEVESDPSAILLNRIPRLTDDQHVTCGLWFIEGRGVLPPKHLKRPFRKGELFLPFKRTNHSKGGSELFKAANYKEGDFKRFNFVDGVEAFESLWWIESK